MRLRAAALWEEISLAFPSYPAGVVPVPSPIAGTAFFPGGLGLLLDESGGLESGSCGVMVVGQDFNTAATYERAWRIGTELDISQTWRNIRIVFPKLGLSPRQCFFTNFYVGLRQTGPETGVFPGELDQTFVHRCARFFERQMEVMKPQLVVTLGSAPLKAIGREVFQIPVPRKLSACVDVYQNLPAAHGRVALCGLTHPCMYFANVHRRRFLGYRGLEAERAMVQHANGAAILPADPATTSTSQSASQNRRSAW